jgi:hypothetical protein
MELIIAPLLLVAVIIYVAYPFLAENSETGADFEEVGEMEKLLLKKEDAIDILKDIEMDYRMGKLSEPDYEELKARHEHRAVEVLQQIENARKPGRTGKKKKKKS